MGANSPPDQDPDRRFERPSARPVPERSFELRIARDGTWYHEGSPIPRIPLVRLFASVLRREPDGTYWLVTPAERGRIEVEDAPFIAVEAAFEGAGEGQCIRLRTNLGEWVTVGPDHPLRVRMPPWQEPGEAGPVPYLEVRAGLEARLARPVYYELVERGTNRHINDGTHFGIWSAGCFFSLDNGKTG